MPPTPPPPPSEPLHTLSRRYFNSGGSITPKQGAILAAVVVPLLVVGIVLKVLYDRNKRRTPPGEDEVRSTEFTRGEAPASAWFARRAAERQAGQAQAQSPPVPPPPYATNPNPISQPTPAHLPASPVTSLPPYNESQVITVVA